MLKEVGLAWWLWILVGVGSAVYVFAVLAMWAVLRISVRFEKLAYGDLVEHYISPRSSEAPASGRDRRADAAATPQTRQHRRRIA